MAKTLTNKTLLDRRMKGLTFDGQPKTPPTAPVGMVEGLGTGTSDSNLIAASTGEYVLPEETVNQIGPDELDQLVRETTGEEPGGKPVERGLTGFSAGGRIHSSIPERPGPRPSAAASAPVGSGLVRGALNILGGRGAQLQAAENKALGLRGFNAGGRVDNYGNVDQRAQGGVRNQPRVDNFGNSNPTMGEQSRANTRNAHARAAQLNPAKMNVPNTPTGRTVPAAAPAAPRPPGLGAKILSPVNTIGKASTGVGLLTHSTNAGDPNEDAWAAEQRAANRVSGGNFSPGDGGDSGEAFEPQVSPYAPHGVQAMRAAPSQEAAEQRGLQTEVPSAQIEAQSAEPEAPLDPRMTQEQFNLIDDAAQANQDSFRGRLEDGMRGGGVRSGSLREALEKRGDLARYEALGDERLAADDAKRGITPGATRADAAPTGFIERGNAGLSTLAESPMMRQQLNDRYQMDNLGIRADVDANGRMVFSGSDRDVDPNRPTVHRSISSGGDMKAVNESMARANAIRGGGSGADSQSGRIEQQMEKMLTSRSRTDRRLAASFFEQRDKAARDGDKEKGLSAELQYRMMNDELNRQRDDAKGQRSEQTRLSEREETLERGDADRDLQQRKANIDHATTMFDGDEKAGSEAYQSVVRNRQAMLARLEKSGANPELAARLRGPMDSNEFNQRLVQTQIEKVLASADKSTMRQALGAGATAATGAFLKSSGSLPARTVKAGLAGVAGAVVGGGHGSMVGPKGDYQEGNTDALFYDETGNFHSPEILGDKIKFANDVELPLSMFDKRTLHILGRNLSPIRGINSEVDSGLRMLGTNRS